MLQGGCIIRAKFLDDIKQAYQRDPALENLLMDPFFAENLAERQESWRRVVSQVTAAALSPWRDCPCAPRGGTALKASACPASIGSGRNA